MYPPFSLQRHIQPSCFAVLTCIVEIPTIVNKMSRYYTLTMISYRPFWDTLEKSGETTYTLINKHTVSSSTINRLRKGLGISTITINDLCKILSCKVATLWSTLMISNTPVLLCGGFLATDSFAVLKMIY